MHPFDVPLGRQTVVWFAVARCVVNCGDEGERRGWRSWDARVGDRFALGVISLVLDEGDAAEVLFGGHGELDVRALLLRHPGPNALVGRSPTSVALDARIVAKRTRQCGPLR